MNIYEEVIINDSLEESVIDCKFLVAWHYTHNNDVDIPCMSKSCKDCIKAWLDGYLRMSKFLGVNGE